LFATWVVQVIEEELLLVLEPAMNGKGGDTPGGRRPRNISLGAVGATLGKLPF
jgi:hypothetical protein